MSKLGKKIVRAVKEANKKDLVTLSVSPDVAKLREKLNLSQQQFAKTYHINPETIKSWEQHKRKPDSISKVYLKCIAKNPKFIKKLVNS
ncbi:MAG: hypothetical protein A3F17_04975 [Gammaproteobacteria bacterium RIFCSPHIGHO2_12_FULL_41_15]|nr:MAG: hypothetical protein A3F17_04975 [Gammaproteobacteria bacterium RIFCSPHIGHO2_12_FULL_41_15]